MDESVTSAPRGYASYVVPVSSLTTVLDYLVVASPFQSGGSQSDDFLYACSLARTQLGEQKSSPEYALQALSTRVDNSKRLKNKCELIAAHRPSQYDLYLIFLLKMLEDPSTVVTLKQEGGDLAPSKAENLIKETISRLIKASSQVHSVNTYHQEDVPKLPNWFSSRPGISDDFVVLNQAIPKDSTVSPNSKVSAPLEAQEHMLIGEFLSAMMGIEGQYLVIDFETNSSRNGTLVSNSSANPENLDLSVPETRSNFRECYWKVDRSVTPLSESLVLLVEKMLPLCQCYVEINKFVDEFSQFDRGMIAHAVASATSTLLRDYLILVAQLEHQHSQGHLTLQKVWYYIQTSLDSMWLLRDFVKEASHRKGFGAQLLNMLFDRWIRTASDQNANELFVFLLQKGCVPYWDMLKSWIYKGFVKDPYGEFMIEENRKLAPSILSNSSTQSQQQRTDIFTEETYWEKKYTLRTSQIPVFLESIQQKILTTGKYINAIRECGFHVDHEKADSHSNNNNNNGSLHQQLQHLSSEQQHYADIENPSSQNSKSDRPKFVMDLEEFSFTTNERIYVEKIERAYQYASGSLLDILRNDFSLMSKLRSIKHYFLLDQGDWLLHFVDVAEDDLKKPANVVQPSSLQTMFDIAVRASVLKDNELNECIRVKLLPYNLINQLISRHRKEAMPSSSLKDMSVLEALTLDWQVGWPLVLIFNQNTLDMYQILFRHLFYCKHVERIIGKAWTHHQLTKTLFIQKSQQRTSSPALSGGNAKGGKTGGLSSSLNAKKTSMVQSSSNPSIPSQIEDKDGGEYQLLIRCFSLRQRMLHFIQNLQSFMIMEVIEPRFLVLQESLLKATTVDDLLNAHKQFLINCHLNCLLTELDLFKIITKLLSVCVIFCNYTERFIKQLTLGDAMDDEKAHLPKDPKAKAAAAAKKIEQQRSRVATIEARKVFAEKGFGATMAKFEANFDKYYRMLIEATTTFQNPAFPDHGLLSLNMRLDFNDYYSLKFQQ